MNCLLYNPVAFICHGEEILATADVIRDKKVTTIPKCRFDVTSIGGDLCGRSPGTRWQSHLCQRQKGCFSLD
ncbi:hypothetical protein GF406_25810 [candidate division KSB1 bacterium]|nr:hypothetical protein [candidate division KSB1 bacterium]